MTNPDDSDDLNVSLERDAEIGRDTYLRLQRLKDRLARTHGIGPERAADFLAGGVLFLIAELYNRSLDEAAELVAELARSVQHDELRPETRH